MTVQVNFVCPRCDYRVDAASVVGPDAEQADPRPGDISMCLRCGAPLEFQDEAPPRWLTYDELVAAARDNPEGKARIVTAILHIVTMRPSGVKAVPWKGGLKDE